MLALEKIYILTISNTILENEMLIGKLTSHLIKYKKVINMVISKKLLTLFAIFCIIASAGIVCAAEEGGYAGSNYQSMNGASGSQYYVNNANNLEPGAGLPLENQTGYVPLDADGNPIFNATATTTSNATGNATGHVTGNATANTTANATGNSTNATAPSSLLATGNPIMILLAVIAVIGGYGAIRRRK